MIRSMTGYGEGERALSNGRLRVTIKTVNHRFFNAHLRTPQGFNALEAPLQGWLKGFFSRGHVSCTVSWNPDRDEEREALPRVDRERAARLVSMLREVRDDLDLGGEVDLATLLRFGDVLVTPELDAQAPPVARDDLREVTEEAARAVLMMREREGAHMKEDLLERVQSMEESLAIIEDRAPERLVEERDRLREAIRELAQDETVDEDRLAREVAYLAERWDINEEVVRFRGHLQAFRETLEDPGPTPVGKRLGFLVQEMHREATTVGSKANDLEMSHASVAIREEIERLREQLENVE